jgi:drug/metabolite transporter (DMT)-like permease
MAVFGKLAYDDGATPGTLLSVRFVLAAAMFWVLAAAGAAGARPPWLARGGRDVARAGAGAPHAAARFPLTRRDVLAGLALGACGYALQAGCYFVALERIDASLLSLLVYTYPALVAAAASLLGREAFDRRRIGALALASVGLAAVLAGAGAGAIDPLGAALGIAAALVYTTYILVSGPVAARVPPLLLAGLVCTGAAVTLTAGSAVAGQLRPGDVGPAGWLWLACLALVSTVAAIALFFAGLRRAGPTAASILSTVEPVVTVGLAFLVFGETLSAAQLAGGALVIAAVVVLQLRPIRRAAARPVAASPSRSSAG